MKEQDFVFPVCCWGAQPLQEGVKHSRPASVSSLSEKGIELYLSGSENRAEELFGWVHLPQHRKQPKSPTKQKHNRTKPKEAEEVKLWCSSALNSNMAVVLVSQEHHIPAKFGAANFSKVKTQSCLQMVDKIAFTFLHCC